MVTPELIKQAEEHQGFQPKALSASAITGYLRCPIDYFNKYVLGNWNNEYSHDLVLGNMVHKGIETYYKTHDKEEVKKAVYLQAKAEKMHLHTTTEEFLEELTRVLGMIKENMSYLNTWVPRSLEHFFTTEIQSPADNKTLGIPVRGRMDLITIDGKIIDHKTAKALKPNVFYDSDLQLPIYKMVYRKLFSEEPTELVLNVLLKRDEGEYMSQTVPVKVDEDREEEVFHIVKGVLANINNGVWIQDKSEPGCGLSWCDTCKEEE